MTGIYTLFVILIVIASILMIGIVLIQESKGGGLASNFSSSNQIMGVRKTTDFIEKATWTLAAAMVVCSIICAHVAPTAVTGESVIEKAATEEGSTNPNNLPNFGASQQQKQAETDKNAKQAEPAKETAKPEEAAQGTQAPAENASAPAENTAAPAENAPAPAEKPAQ